MMEAIDSYLETQEPDDNGFAGYSDDMMLADACRNPVARLKLAAPETANVANLCVADVYAMDIARDTSTPLAAPCERVIVAYSPTTGTRLVWHTKDYGYQLVQVDMRHNDKVWVFGYIENEARWFYHPLPEDAVIMPAPSWLDFAVEVDTGHVERMQRNTLYPERDNGEFVRRGYR